MSIDALASPPRPAILAPGTSVAPARRGWVRQLGVDTAYTLTGLPLAVAAFGVTVTGLALGAGLAVLGIGLVVLSGTLLAARGLAGLERAWLPSVLRRPPVRRVERQPAGGNRLLAPLRNGQSWRDAAHAVLRLPVAVVGFAVTVTCWAGALGGLTYGAWDWALPHEAGDTDLAELLGFASTAGTRIVLLTAIGAGFAVLLPFAVRAAAVLQARLGAALLTPADDQQVPTAAA